MSSFYDDMRYAQERMRAHGFGEASGGNRRSETSSEGYRGPTKLEIALVQKLGGKVRLYNRDFDDVMNVTVHRTEDKTDDSVILEVRHKNDARDKTIDLVRQPNGSYAVDQYQGL